LDSLLIPHVLPILHYARVKYVVPMVVGERVGQLFAGKERYVMILVQRAEINNKSKNPLS